MFLDRTELISAHFRNLKPSRTNDFRNRILFGREFVHETLNLRAKCVENLILTQNDTFLRDNISKWTVPPLSPVRKALKSKGFKAIRTSLSVTDVNDDLSDVFVHNRLHQFRHFHAAYKPNSFRSNIMESVLMIFPISFRCEETHSTASIRYPKSSTSMCA